MRAGVQPGQDIPIRAAVALQPDRRKRGWDNRGRPLADTDTGPGGVVYSFAIPSSGGYAANGDLLSYTDSVMGAWSFSYDKLDRLMTGTPSSGPYQGQYGCWGYDSFGNRTVSAVGAPSCTGSATATYNANNQITWLQTLGTPGYAPTGNVASDSLNQYLYDNENRVCAVRNLLTNAMTGYLYDGGGERVAKGAVANLNACPAVQGFTSITAQYLLGPDSEQVTELDGSGAWQHTNLFAGGRLLATYDTRGQHFQFTDWLGTKRTQTTAAGVSEEQCQSLPFGDGLSCSGSGVDATEHHFTGRERDVESGNDFLLARYYNSTTRRFLTPDWALKAEPVPYARLDLPQTLNLYAYVGNNPLTHTDVDGHMGASPATPCGADPECDPQANQLNTSEVSARKLDAKVDADARKAQQTQLTASTLGKLGLSTSLHVTADQVAAGVLGQEFRGEGADAAAAGAVVLLNRMIEVESGDTNWGQAGGVSQKNLSKNDNLMLELISTPGQFTALSGNPSHISSILSGKTDSPEYSAALGKLRSVNIGSESLGGFRTVGSHDLGTRDQFRSNWSGEPRHGGILINHTEFF